jgi:hypothetical protein
MSGALSDAFAPVRSAAAHLPDVEESTWYGTPALKVRGKGFCRLKDTDTLVLLCPMDEKEFLLEMEPGVFFETDHYKGWPAVLARLSRIDGERLRHQLERAWRYKAPKRLVRTYDTAPKRR